MRQRPEHAVARRSRIAAITRFDASGFPSDSAEVHGFDDVAAVGDRKLPNSWPIPSLCFAAAGHA
jgi:hypothetical protein